MGIFGKIKDNVLGKSLVDQGVDQVAQTINESTKGKFASEVFQAQHLAKDTIHKVEEHLKHRNENSEEHHEE